MTIDPRHRARGQKAENIFQAWLNREEVPYFYFDQTPFTIPTSLRGLIKRPDFAVGVAGVGTLALDVKSYKIYRDHFWIDVDEHNKLGMFEYHFNIPVYFAILPPGHAPYCYFFRNVDLSPQNAITTENGTFLRIHIDRCDKADHTQRYFRPAPPPPSPPWDISKIIGRILR